MNPLLKDRSEVMRQIDLGLDVEAFVQSNLGKHLLSRAQDSALEAMDELKKIAPTETDRIRELQNIIYRAESFEGWLLETLEQGRNSEEQLELMNTQE